jgi:thiamine biosynthesis protein ThiC
MKVGIAGIGGIGSNVARHLAQAWEVGQGLKTNINVNLGVSKDVCSFGGEMNKAMRKTGSIFSPSMPG